MLTRKDLHSECSINMFFFSVPELDLGQFGSGHNSWVSVRGGAISNGGRGVTLENTSIEQ